MNDIDYLILGADGQQGLIASRYLLQAGKRVVLSDIYCDNLLAELAEFRPTFHFCDHRKPENLQAMLHLYRPRVVINCANDFCNDAVTDACLHAKAHCVDLGSDIAGTMRRLARHEQFKAAGLTYIMGCGSVPGIGSVMLRYLSDRFRVMDSAEAGFAWDSNRHDFVPPFFLFVVLLELSRPTELLRGGEIVYEPPMSREWKHVFPMIGRQILYAVPHSEVATFHHYYASKGLKDMTFWAGFPEHSREVINALIRAGLNSDKPISVVTAEGVAHVTPCDFLTAAAKRIPTPAGYTESEVLWATIGGERHDGEECAMRMECHVPPLPGWERFGCNVDTAFPACVIAQMIDEQEITERGVFCPEGVVPAERFLARMERHGVSFRVDGLPTKFSP